MYHVCYVYVCMYVCMYVTDRCFTSNTNVFRWVGSEHTEHISSLDFVDVAAMMKKSELWVQPCFKNIAIIYALDTAHEKYGV